MKERVNVSRYELYLWWKTPRESGSSLFCASVDSHSDLAGMKLIHNCLLRTLERSKVRIFNASDDRSLLIPFGQHIVKYAADVISHPEKPWISCFQEIFKRGKKGFE